MGQLKPHGLYPNMTPIEDHLIYNLWTSTYGSFDVL